MVTPSRPKAPANPSSSSKPRVDVRALIERGGSPAAENGSVPITSADDLLKIHNVQLRIPQYVLNQIGPCRVAVRQKSGRHKKPSQHAFLLNAVLEAIERCQKAHNIQFGPNETCPPVNG